MPKEAGSDNSTIYGDLAAYEANVNLMLLLFVLNT